MATSSVILDIRANTKRALSDFKTFSSQLDNKFLISGLKLDVVRNALSQINREFKKSLGEEGLSSAQSLKAAENQVAVLTNVFAGFSKTASAQITEDFSSALNKVAVKTGSTLTDVKKSLAAVPFLSNSLSSAQKEKTLTDILSLQTSARRAGLGEDAGGIISRFLAGQVTGKDLLQTPDALSNSLGKELSTAGGFGEVNSVEQRTQILKQALANIDLEKFAEETGGFRTVLERFSAALFNPKEGLFGSLKEFTLANDEEPTNLFKETTALFNSIFGPEGFIMTLGRELGKAFGLGGQDDEFVKFLGRGIRFITNLIKGVTALIDDVMANPIVKSAIDITKKAFNGVVSIFKGLEKLIVDPSNLSTFSSVSVEDITKSVSQVGESTRKFLKLIGATIRGEDISDEAEGGASIAATLVKETGHTMLVFFKEIGESLLAKAGTIAIEVAKTLPGVIGSLISKIVGGEGGIIPQLLLALGVGKLAMGAGKTVGALRSAAYSQGGGAGGLGRSALSRVNQEFGYALNEGGMSSRELERRNRQRDARNRRMGGGLGRPPGGLGRPPGEPDLGLIEAADEILGQLRDEGRNEDDNRRESRAKTAAFARRREKDFLDRKITVNTSEFATRLPDRYGMIRPKKEESLADQINRNMNIGQQFSRSKINTQTSMFAPSIGELFPYLAIDDDQINPKLIAAREAREEEEREKQYEINYESAERNRKARPRRDVRNRYARRYGRGALMRNQAGRVIKGLPKMGGKLGLAVGGLGLLAGGLGLFNAGDAEAAEFDPETGMMVEPPPEPKKPTGQKAMESLSGGMEGAMLGATIGSIVPGVGTAAGAVIGGIIGGVAPLIDEGTKKGAVEFISGMGKSISDLTSGIGKGATNLVTLAGKWWGELGNKLKGFFTESLPKMMWEALNVFYGGLPRTLLNFGKSLATNMLKSVAEFDLGKTLKDSWSSMVNALRGKGWTPDGERAVGGPFTRGGTYLVGERGPELATFGQSGTITTNRELQAMFRPNQNSARAQATTVFNITVNATGLAGDDIAKAIKPAVTRIIDDAWSTQNAPTGRRTTV